MEIDRYFRLDRRDVVYLAFILESYDGLGIATTVDPKVALVRVRGPKERAEELGRLLDALVAEIPMTETGPDGTDIGG